MMEGTDHIIEAKRFARAVRSNPKFRGKQIKDMPRHRRIAFYCIISLFAVFAVLISVAFLELPYLVFLVLFPIPFVILFAIKLVPASLLFLGYWFPKIGLFGAKLHYWLELDFEE